MLAISAFAVVAEKATVSEAILLKLKSGYFVGSFGTGLVVFSTLGVVYEDDCCHYTQRGNDLLADFVAARAAQPNEQVARPRALSVFAAKSCPTVVTASS